jgi:nitroreductase
VMVRCGHGSTKTRLLQRARSHAQIGHAMNENLPALPESQSAVAVWVAKATVAKVARENFMMKCSARGIGQCWCEV